MSPTASHTSLLNIQMHSDEEIFPHKHKSSALISALLLLLHHTAPSFSTPPISEVHKGTEICRMQRQLPHQSIMELNYGYKTLVTAFCIRTKFKTGLNDKFYGFLSWTSPPVPACDNPLFTPPLKKAILYLKVWVPYFHKSHILNKLQLIQNMMLVNSKLPKTFKILTQTLDST